MKTRNISSLTIVILVTIIKNTKKSISCSFSYRNPELSGLEAKKVGMTLTQWVLSSTAMQATSPPNYRLYARNTAALLIPGTDLKVVISYKLPNHFHDFPMIYGSCVDL